jgi:hypothetical protein
MVLHGSFFVCIGFTTACLLYLIVYSFIRDANNASFDDAINRVRRITNEFVELQQLQGRLCWQVAALIREDCQGLLDFIDRACFVEPPQDGEIRELMRAAHAKGLGVYWRPPDFCSNFGSGQPWRGTAAKSLRQQCSMPKRGSLFYASCGLSIRLRWATWNCQSRKQLMCICMERTPYSLPAALQDNRSYKQFWITLRCSGADPSASRKPWRNTLQCA